MKPSVYSLCPECDSKVEACQPFCHMCGKLSPGVSQSGNQAVELTDVPSEKARADLLRTLKAWFPAIDGADAAHRLKAGRSILIRGIDEESGERVLDALRSLKVPGRLVPTGLGGSLARRLFNPGVAVGGLLLLAAAIIDGWIGLVLTAGALGSPIGWMLRRNRQDQPLVRVRPQFDYEKWSGLAADYGYGIKNLDPADAEILRSLVREIFHLYRLLGADSLAAAAAGQEDGYFHERLTEALSRAVEIGREMIAAEDEKRLSLRKELQTVADLVESTGNWFRALTRNESQLTPDLSAQFSEIRDRIDRTMEEIRPAERRSRPSAKLRS
jgi:hypothetical protein